MSVATMAMKAKKAGSAANKLSKMDMLSMGLTGYFGYQGYKDSRAQGNSFATSALSAAGEIVKGEMLGLPGMLAVGALEAIPKLAVKATMGINKLSRQQARNRYGSSMPFYNSTFMDTQQAYTMRQAGMQLAENSKYNLQQSLMGNEAQMLHM